MNKLIIDILKPLNVPVSFQKYSGNSNTYITFHEYYVDGEAFDDDEETLTNHYIQIDVWSKTDYTILVKRVKELLVENDFKRLGESDLYEEDTKIYHRVMKFYYLERRVI